MNKIYKKVFVVLLLALLLGACEKQDDIIPNEEVDEAVMAEAKASLMEFLENYRVTGSEEIFLNELTNEDSDRLIEKRGNARSQMTKDVCKNIKWSSGPYYIHTYEYIVGSQKPRSYSRTDYKLPYGMEIYCSWVNEYTRQGGSVGYNWYFDVTIKGYNPPIRRIWQKKLTPDEWNWTFFRIKGVPGTYRGLSLKALKYP